MARQVQSLFIILFLLLSIHSISAEITISMKLSDLEIWMKNNSPEIKIIDQEKKLNKLAEYIEAGLPFTNPEFSFKKESMNDGIISDSEKEFELSKSFKMPWIYSARKAGWKYKKEAIELSSMSYRNELMAGMRSGYIELVLMRKNLKEYKNTEVILKDLLDTISRKEKEGFVSPINLRLITLALTNMEIHIMEMEFELDFREKRWKQSAGIDPEVTLNLTTGIKYLPAELTTLDSILGLYRSSPGYRKWGYSEKELREKISAEKMGFIPEITLGAGFKKISAGLKGPTFGISFGIPLLNRNTIMVKKIKLEKEIHNSRMNWSVRNDHNEITAWYGMVKRYGELLSRIKEPPVSPSTGVLPLLDAFQEGTINVNDLTGGIQLYMDGMENYHSVLTHYYHNIFKIESRTGERLVALN